MTTRFGNVAFETALLRLRGYLQPPIVLDEGGEELPLPALSSWHWQGSQQGSLALGSLGEGLLISSEWQWEGHALVCDLWRPTTGPGAALRLRWLNRGGSPIRLASMPILELCVSAHSGRELSAALFVQGRHKNDTPEVVHLSDLLEDRPGAAGGSPNTLGSGDPFVQLQLTGHGQSGQLLMGFLTMQSQLTECMASADKAHQCLLRLVAKCDLDRVLVCEGEERASEWLWLDWQDGWWESLQRYTEAVGTLAGVSSPPPPPTVFCSWYYADDAFAQEDLEDNLLWLRDNPTPLDVFQIDMCWDRRWGDWVPNHRWPQGMAHAASLIREAGFQPGLWTCPFLVESRADLRLEHPEWLLRRRDGREVTFAMMGILARVLDPTHPEANRWLEDTYRRLTEEWGFSYHKLDFMRAVALDEEAVFYNPRATRAEAYRLGLEAIRRGTGPEAYIMVCGGLYGPSLGLASGQRVGSDVHSQWDEHTTRTLQQSLLRTWMTRLWHTDPDALMIRRRSEPFKKRSLSLGFTTDSEARILALVQYLAGGIVCVSERLSDFDADRYALWRQIIPSLGAAARPVDLFTSDGLPSIYHTYVQPVGTGLAPWHTLALLNWRDQEHEFGIRLDEQHLGRDFETERAYLVWEFYEQRFVGLFHPGERLPDIAVPAHDVRLLRVVGWEEKPTLLGTDLHLSGGGVEVAEWTVEGGCAQFHVQSRWPVPVTAWVALPGGAGRLPEIRRYEAGPDGAPVRQ